MKNTFKYAVLTVLLAGSAVNAFGISASNQMVQQNLDDAQIRQLTNDNNKLFQDLETLLMSHGKLTLEQAKNLIDAIKVKFSDAQTKESTLETAINQAFTDAQTVQTFATGTLKTAIEQALTDAQTVQTFATNDLSTAVADLGTAVTTCEKEIDTTSQDIKDAHHQVVLEQAEQAHNTYEVMLANLLSNGEISYSALLNGIDKLSKHVVSKASATTTSLGISAGSPTGGRAPTIPPFTPSTDNTILILNMIRAGKNFEKTFDDGANQLNSIQNNL